MQVDTEQIPKHISRIYERLNQFSQQKLFDQRRIYITEEDHKTLASDLVKLDQFLYLTDVKESLHLAII